MGSDDQSGVIWIRTKNSREFWIKQASDQSEIRDQFWKQEANAQSAEMAKFWMEEHKKQEEARVEFWAQEEKRRKEFRAQEARKTRTLYAKLEETLKFIVIMNMALVVLLPTYYLLEFCFLGLMTLCSAALGTLGGVSSIIFEWIVFTYDQSSQVGQLLLEMTSCRQFPQVIITLVIRPTCIWLASIFATCVFVLAIILLPFLVHFDLLDSMFDFDVCVVEGDIMVRWFRVCLPALMISICWLYLNMRIFQIIAKSAIKMFIQIVRFIATMITCIVLLCSMCFFFAYVLKTRVTDK